MNPYVMLAFLLIIGVAGFAIHHVGRQQGKKEKSDE